MKIKTLHIYAILALLAASILMPSGASAIELTTRKVTLGSSAGAAATTYDFSFKPGTSGNIGAIKMQICDSPLAAVACVNSGGSSGASFLTNSASLAGQTGISGFTTGSGTPPAPTANTFWITNGTPQNVSNSTTVTISLQNVHNPTATNTQFYARVTTYSDSAGTAEVDFGAMALSTASQITVSGTMPESLVFCVGTSGTNCSNITGSTVNLGTFSPTSTNTGTSVMSASTNAGFGYAITINGSTLQSGSNTIPAMSGAASNIGTSQFGTNLRANTTPSVGADVSGSGSGAAAAGYNTANQFRFTSTNTVASASGPTTDNLYTNSYIVNVAGNQAAGVYTATLTYICTATF